jgi:hypothetical protein
MGRQLASLVNIRLGEKNVRYKRPRYEKTLVAWFVSNLLLNIQMYNMSSLHKYN